MLMGRVEHSYQMMKSCLRVESFVRLEGCLGQFLFPSENSENWNMIDVGDEEIGFLLWDYFVGCGINGGPGPFNQPWRRGRNSMT
jgi:hypothetical protein